MNAPPRQLVGQKTYMLSLSTTPQCHKHVAAKEESMTRTIRYASDADSLFFPGEASDFFPRGGAVPEAALCAEMARVAYVKHEDGRKGKLTDILHKIGFTIVDLLNVGGTQGLRRRRADGRG